MTETQELQSYIDEIYGKGFYMVEYVPFKGFTAVAQAGRVSNFFLGETALHAHSHLDELDDLMLQQIITLREASDTFDIPYQTLHSAVKEGRLDARQSGATWLTTRAAVKRFSS